MSTGNSRFRIGKVNAAASAAERARQHLDDGTQLYAVANEHLQRLARDLDATAILELLAVVREHADHHRVYSIHKLAAATVISASAQRGGQAADDFEWAAWYDLVPAMLLPCLQERPAEPDLLNLLGIAYYELGFTPLARRIFEAIKEIEPEHTQARANLKGCKERAKRGAGTPKVPDAHTTRARELHSAARDIADRAVRLEPRTISLCMIVKDEEEMLPGCLAAVQGWVDQVIVCDTGSNDRTREIALEYGAELVEFEWTGSFSDARNKSLEGATGDWIIYLDADEHMVDDDGRHLRELAKKTWVEGFYLVETHYTGEFEVGSQSTHMALRMYQNRPHYHFQGIIHEQKLHNFPTFLPERFQNSPVRINHYGYLKDVIQDRSKRQRNLDLLELAAAEQPDDAFTQFNIGSEYAASFEWEQALGPFERALELSRLEVGWQAQQFAPMMVSRLINSRRGTGDLDGALDLIAEGLSYWPDFTDLIYERSLILSERQEYEQALREAQQCLTLGDAPNKYVAVKGKGTYQARTLIAMILRRQGDVAGARAQLEQALEEAPHFLPNVLELAEVMLVTDQPDAVAAHLEAVLGERAEGPNANLLLATAFYEAAHLEHAERYYGRVLEASPDNSAALVGMAELRLAQHRAPEAWEIAMRVAPSDPMATRSARTAFLAAIVEGDHTHLDEPLRIIQAAEYLPIGDRSFYAAWNARVTGNSAVLAPSYEASAQVLANLEALAKLKAPEQFEQLMPLLDQALVDERERHLRLGGLYLRRRFADMAAEEYMFVTQRFGPEPEALTGLGKVATIKEMWEDAEVFLSESLKLDPAQDDAQKLLQLIRERSGPGGQLTGQPNG